MTGDQNDILARLQRWLPQGWFPNDPGTRIYAILSGFASLLAAIYAMVSYVKLQTLLATTTDGFLDLASLDFFGTNLPRLNAERDTVFSLRIRKEILRDRLTRNAIDSLLFDMTGAHPTIVELERPIDTGAWRSGYFAWRSSGHYASRFWRESVFIITPPAGQFSIPNVGGWRGYLAAWRIGSFVYEDPSALIGSGYSNAQMMSALDRVRAAGITYWVWIENPELSEPAVTLDTETGATIDTETGQHIII